jgi:hypothetical protein
MKFKYDRSFKFKINDDVWEGYLLTEEEALELDSKLNDSDDGFQAITLLTDKCLFVTEGSVDKETITHEAFHVYVYYLHIDSSKLTVAQFEETIAEFLGSNLVKFTKKCNYLYNKFKKLEGKK